MDRHSLGPALEVVAAMVPRIEAERRLPREVVDALVAAGVFKRMVPRAYGGADASVREAIEAIEAIARSSARSPPASPRSASASRGRRSTASSRPPG